MTENIEHDISPPLIGCAGWSIPKEVGAAFEGEGSHLERYARVFKGAEINSSFYRPHRPQTYQRWAASVPADFRFSVKVPRSITHDAKLIAVEDLLDRFIAEAGQLGDKLGCILVQLPPKQQFDAQVAGAFFVLLKQRVTCMIACEARHPSWFSDEATALLTGHQVTRVIADPAAGQPGPHVPTTDAVYLRLHGSPRVYYSSYEPDYIAGLGRDLACRVAAGHAVWCIFDNTASGAATANALDLQNQIVTTA